MVLGSASSKVTTSKVCRSRTGASVRSVVVVFWPCGIALVSGRGSNNAVLSHGQAGRVQIVRYEGSAEEILVRTDGTVRTR
jgi:hypothetical protein